MNKTKSFLLGFSALLNISSNISAAQEWYTETLYDSWRQTFSIDEKIYEEKTEHQHLLIFNNKTFGKVLALDGVIQITEKDEFVYQEMMAHVPLIAHGNPKKVLIIGGGDGGILREVLKHTTIEKAVLVEIDASVVEFSKKHLAKISDGAFDDPRAEVIITDGCEYVKQCSEKFDVIICDSTDPIGPGAVLFTSEFYRDCHNLLSEGGIFVNQNGVPFLQQNEMRDTYKNRASHFKDVGFYLGVIPSYVGGFMAFGWASDNACLRQIPLEEITNRLSKIKGSLRYYTPAIHNASFVLPKFLDDVVTEEAHTFQKSK